MTAAERAMLYLRRNRSKSIRLGLVCFVLTVFLLLCVWNYLSNQNAAFELRQTISASFRLDGTETQAADDELIQKVLACANIRAYNGENAAHLYSRSTPPVPGHFAGSGEDAEYMMRYLANHNSELEQAFQDGTLVLSEGRHIQPQDQRCAVISTALAEQNGLSIGDTIEASYTPGAVQEDPALAGVQYAFTIVGLFDIVDDKTAGTDLAETDKRENSVFIDAATGHEIKRTAQPDTTYDYGVTFFVNDPQYLEATMEEVGHIVDLSRYEVTVNDKAYRDSVQPLERICSLMKLLMAVLSLCGIVLLSLVLQLWLRQRTREIGIYLSAGIGKRNILCQLLLESVCAAAAACVIAVPVAWGAMRLAARLLGQGTSGIPLWAWITVVAVVLCIAAVSTVLSSVRVFRMKPREILIQTV